jgi:hypothetical protein
MKVLIATLITSTLFIIVGCNALKIDKKRVSKISYRNPGVLKEYCANNFKGKDSVYKEVKYLPGKIDTIEGQTIIIDCDSVSKDTVYKTKTVQVKCPPSTAQHDTVYDHQYHWEESPQMVAKVEMLQDSLSMYKGRLVEKSFQLTTTISLLRKYQYIVWGFAIILILFLIIKYIIKWKLPSINKIIP